MKWNPKRTKGVDDAGVDGKGRYADVQRRSIEGMGYCFLDCCCRYCLLSQDLQLAVQRVYRLVSGEPKNQQSRWYCLCCDSLLAVENAVAVAVVVAVVHCASHRCAEGVEMVAVNAVIAVVAVRKGRVVAGVQLSDLSRRYCCRQSGK